MSITEGRARRGRPKNVNADQAGKKTVKALDRGLRVLSFLARSGGATMSEVSDATRTPVATVHRILSTLEARSMIKLDAGTGKWTVGPQTYQIGMAYPVNHDLIQTAMPIMQQVAKQTGETTNLAISDNEQLFYVAQVESDNPIRASIKNGEFNHFNTSGVGKAILSFMSKPKQLNFLSRIELVQQTPNSITDQSAFLEELDVVKARGWALDDEERFVGMRCIAAPVFGPSGEAIAGLSVSGPSDRLKDSAIPRVAKVVKNATRSVSKTLRFFTPQT